MPEQLLEEWVGSLEELLEGRQQTVEEARRFPHGGRGRGHDGHGDDHVEEARRFSHGDHVHGHDGHGDNDEDYGC